MIHLRSQHNQNINPAIKRLAAVSWKTKRALLLQWPLPDDTDKSLHLIPEVVWIAISYDRVLHLDPSDDEVGIADQRGVHPHDLVNVLEGHDLQNVLWLYKMKSSA